MTTIEDDEERIQLARRHLQQDVSLAQAIATLLTALPADAPVPTLRDAIRQILGLVLESTIMRGREFAKAIGRHEHQAARGSEP